MTSTRTGQAETKISREEFLRQFKKNFYDPNFDVVQTQINQVAEIAWENYNNSRKAPRTQKAGPEFHDPEYDLSIEWLANHKKINILQNDWEKAPTRVLVINGSPRNEHTCPSEISKSFRMKERAVAKLAELGIQDVDYLDLSLTTAQYGKQIHPCKACVSTAMPLCHWPCSCYPNHSLGQVHDWMPEIYEKWVAAHGILIITPVHWYQATSPLKLMIDRLVCADGGNPDPTSTHGKKADEARKLELQGWDYPRHLKDRVFGVFVHGDAAGAETLRRNLTDWLGDMGLIPADHEGFKDRYIGYLQPYATNHEDLDKDKDVFIEIDNMVQALLNRIHQVRQIPQITRDKDSIEDPRPK